MSRAASHSDFEHLTDQITAGTERLLREADDPSNETLAATAAELWDVVEEAEHLLETIDLENLPDTIDASALPDLVELDALPDAVRERAPGAALDLSALHRIVELRELWNTVDVVEFRKALKSFESELEDVVGPDALDAAGDSKTSDDVERFVDEVESDAPDAAIQQQAKKQAKTARNAVISGHSKFEALYESNQRGSGYAGRRPASKNPTAVSSVPHGPLPASVSTRVSTVPRNVRLAKVDALPRIYGRRWRTVEKSE